MNLRKYDRDFRIKEYEVLSNDLHDVFRDAPINERWMLITLGLLWSWIFTYNHYVVNFFIYFIPFTLSFMFYLRMKSYKRKQKIIARYRRRIEKQLTENNQGWERFYQLTSKYTNSSFKYYSRLYWLILNGGNLGLGVWFYLEFPCM